MTSSTATQHRGLVVDGLLVVAVLIFGLIFLEPGIFSVDESHYLLTANALVEEGSFHIENGYEHYRASELLFFYTVIPDDLERLGTYSTVPPYHALLAAPLFSLFGLPGLFWLNLLAFAASAVAVRRLASRIKPEGPFAPTAAAVFLLGSFGLEYALGIWPHSLSQALVVWALVTLLSASASTGKGTWILATISGLLLGLAIGVRVYNVLLLPVFVFMARWNLKSSWRLLAAHGIGWAVPLVGYSLINIQRLGTPNPFTYGAKISLTGSIPGRLVSWVADHPWVLALVAVAGAALWWLWRKARWKGLIPGLGVVILAAFTMAPALREMAGHWLSMTGFHLLDTTFLPADGVAVGSRTNELGQLLYGGVLKKGLLEVAPFLVLSLLILPARWVRLEVPRHLYLLSGTGLLYLALLPLVSTTGGFCYNPRYLLEVLPLLTVVSLYWGFRLSSPRVVLLIGILVGALLSLPLLLHPGSVDNPSGGWMPMVIPLALGFLLLASSSVVLVRRGLWRGVARHAASGLLAAALTYGVLIQLGVDLNRSLTVRHYAMRILEEGRQVVSDQSVLFAWEARKDVFSPLKLEGDIIIAGIGPGDRNVPDLIRQAMADRRIFMLQDGIPPDLWAEWSHPYRIQEHERHGLIFVELQPKEDPQ